MVTPLHQRRHMPAFKAPRRPDGNSARRRGGFFFFFLGPLRRHSDGILDERRAGSGGHVYTANSPFPSRHVRREIHGEGGAGASRLTLAVLFFFTPHFVSQFVIC